MNQKTEEQISSLGDRLQRRSREDFEDSGGKSSLRQGGGKRNYLDTMAVSGLLCRKPRGIRIETPAGKKKTSTLR
jgi:hypothetical protein